MQGACYLIRYLDDFVVCFQYRADALRFQEVLSKRLAKFSLTLESSKTKLIEFGCFSQRHAKERGRQQETIYFLGFTHYCSRNRKGNFQIARKTEKTRLRRGFAKESDIALKNRHKPLKEQARAFNLYLRGHYAYYGLGGNQAGLHKIHIGMLRNGGTEP